LMQLFDQVRQRRVNFETQWEEAAQLCWPEYRNTFSFGHTRTQGAKQTEYQVDSTGSIASHRFMAICDALLTPFSMPWSIITADNKDLLKDQTARLYFYQLTETLWAQRYRAEANFTGQNQQNYQALGVFGNMGMFVDALDPTPGQFSPGLRYVSTSPGEIYVLQNHQGRVDGYIRHFRWTARQAYQRWKDAIPQTLHAALEKNDQTLYDFLQFVIPRTDYDPKKIFAPQGKAWGSTYVSVTGYCILEEGGYRTFPLPYGRYQQAPEEDYGRGPAQMVLPELKTLNAEKGIFLKQGHRAADPAYLIGDDGLMDFKSHPGSYNYGGFNEQGRMMVGILPTGDIKVSQDMLATSAAIINDAFLTTLFPLLFDDKGGQKSAREVIEAANDRGIFLAPTLGRQYGEYLGTMIDRELDVLASLGLLPEMPESVREAKGEYKIIYTSPLAKALSGHKTVGFMRTAEMIGNLVQVGANPALVDYLDFDAAIPGIAEDQFVPAPWIASREKYAAKQKARAQAAERDRQVKEMPGRAAMEKARAITEKARTGGNMGGALTGTPQGGMPMMPGQSAPGGRLFGQPG
jgi:hypothetical protein